jgi:CheY-like chemotaxis protein
VDYINFSQKVRYLNNSTSMLLENELKFNSSGNNSAKSLSAKVSQDTEELLFSSNLPHLLVVEDNPLALKVIEEVIAKAGYDFTSVMNAENALELIKTADLFDLILTDIGLPGMSGNDLARCVREWEQTSHKEPIPIIGITAHAVKKEGEKSLQAGMNEILTKPATLKTMQAIVEEYVLNDAGSVFHQKGGQSSQLGKDLPDDERELFNLEQYPLLDTTGGIKTLGNDAVLTTMLQMMVDTSIPNDEVALKQAFSVNDWPEVEKLAHKIKGGALYCGTIRLRYACQYLERYYKAGHTALLTKLYEQLLQILSDTREYVETWLKENK